MSALSNWQRTIRPMVALGLAALVLTACSSPEPSPDADSSSPSVSSSPSGEASVAAALVATPSSIAATTVLAGDTAETLAAVASQTFFDSAQVVVIATEGEALKAASVAATLGVPVLIEGDQLAGELERLGVEVALAVGPISDPGVDVVVPTDDADLARIIGAGGADDTSVPVGEHVTALLGLTRENPALLSTEETIEGSAEPAASPEVSASPSTSAMPEPPVALESDRDELPPTGRPEASGITVMTTGDDRDAAAVATAIASGADVIIVPGGDPRASSESIAALAETTPEVTVGIGPEFVDAETLTWRVQSAATGVELPGGGQLVLPNKTYVALYGTPGTSALGVLGEQDVPTTVARAAALAKEYQPLVDHPVVPAMEIIATVASADAGADGDYSNELPIETLKPLVDLAGENGQYVLLDLQPGRTDFLTQAKLYEDLLKLPHVGLALDPEWRLLPNQVHLRQIGHVEVAEVNEVVTWLADLTRENDLPQKMLVLHQFQIQSLRDVNDVDQTRSEIALLIHVDGLGSQGAKQGTWRALINNAPTITNWGWKNFYDEDIPAPLTPAETMTLVDPIPDFVSYH